MNKSGGEAHIFLTKNRFVPILKERAVSLVASVVGYSITREKPSHDCRGGKPLRFEAEGECDWKAGSKRSTK